MWFQGFASKPSEEVGEKTAAWVMNWSILKLQDELNLVLFNSWVINWSILKMQNEGNQVLFNSLILSPAILMTASEVK